MRKEKGRGFFCLLFLQNVKPIKKGAGFRTQDAGFGVRGSGFRKYMRIGDIVFAILPDR
jgi:hypothetical protein